VKESSTTSYGVQELADLGGVSRRTVRYYVRIGLLPTPTGKGRGKHYNQGHLDRLIEVRKLQESGVSLEEIGALSLSNKEAVEQLEAQVVQSTWTRFELGEGAELHVRGRGLSHLEMTRMREAYREIMRV